MTDHIRSIAVLDACVLYPAPIRDFLLHLADLDLFVPKWSTEIHDEWTRNLLNNRPDLSIDQLKAATDAMNRAFPDADVTGYEKLIENISLPDPTDTHVLAAAMHCGADLVITVNLRDFPNDYLSKFGIASKHPVEFVCSLVGFKLLLVLSALQNQVSHLRNPPKTIHEVLSTLKTLGLTTSVLQLEKLL